MSNLRKKLIKMQTIAVALVETVGYLHDDVIKIGRDCIVGTEPSSDAKAMARHIIELMTELEDVYNENQGKLTSTERSRERAKKAKNLKDDSMIEFIYEQ